MGAARTMSIDFKHPFVGHVAVYTGGHPNAKPEQGIITSVNVDANIVFVRYGAGTTSAATTADDRLKFLNGKTVTLTKGASR